MVAERASDGALLAGYAQEKDDQGQPDVYLAPNSPSSAVGRLLQTAGLAQTCGDNNPHNRIACRSPPTHSTSKQLDLTLLGNYRLSNGWTLTSITGWDRYVALRSEDDVIQLSGPLSFFRDSEESSSIQEELRLSSSDGAAWLAGVFFYRNDYDRGKHGERPMFGANGAAAFDAIWPTLLGVPLAAPNQLGLHDSHVDTEYLSAFANVEWPLTDRLRSRQDCVGNEKRRTP